MKFSSSIEYAIHSLVYLARQASDAPVLVADVASAINVSETYLRKVFQQLVRSSIVSSQRGAKGGFHLARPANGITLKDVVESIDGSLPTYTCLKKQRSCSVTLDCPVHRQFDLAREQMAGALDEMSIADIGSEIINTTEDLAWLRV